jgi:hypothetical protein
MVCSTYRSIFHVNTTANRPVAIWRPSRLRKNG